MKFQIKTLFYKTYEFFSWAGDEVRRDAPHSIFFSSFCELWFNKSQYTENEEIKDKINDDLWNGEGP